MEISSPPNIYLFTDYRLFLRERYQYNKAQFHSFSYNWCAQRTQLSPSFLKLLVASKRHASLHHIRKIGEVFKLTKEESRFLTLLFLENTSEDSILRIFFKEALQNFTFEQKCKTTFGISKATKFQQNEILSQPLKRNIMGLAQLSHFPGFQDPQWFKNNLRTPLCTIEEIQRALDELNKDGFISITEDASKVDSFFKTGDTFGATPEVGCTEDLINLLPLAQNFSSHRPAFHSNLQFPVSYESLDKIKEVLTRCLEETFNLSSENEKKDVLVILNITSFTVGGLQKEPTATSKQNTVDL